MIILLLVVCLWKRYYYYLTSGIRKDMIAPEEDKVMVRISKLISNTLLTSPFLEPLMAALVEEKENDYYSSLMKSIGKAVHKWGRVPMWRAPSFTVSSSLCFLRKKPKTLCNFSFSCLPTLPPSLMSIPVIITFHCASV